jgi:DNA-binding response OmpR family regulator
MNSLFISPRLKDMFNILVVEDEGRLRWIIVAYLRNQGVCPTAASTFQEAVCVLDKGEVDLVVLDLKLVNGEGMHVLKYIRESPDLSHMPVLAMSAWDMEPASHDYLEPGDYLLKPFDLRTLNLMVQRLLEFPQATQVGVGKEHYKS